MMFEWINSEQGLTVLRILVLLMALVWLLSGGFRFGRRPKRKNEQDDEK